MPKANPAVANDDHLDMELQTTTERLAKTSNFWADWDRPAGIDDNEGTIAEPPDRTFIMTFLDNFVPFLFPFYRPSLLHGGRAWILHLILSSIVMKHTALCLSAYFFSVSVATRSELSVCRSLMWSRVLTKTKGAFETLRHSLKAVGGRGVCDQLPQAVHILTSIVQVQRFEVAVLSFENCQAHLNAALALFTQILSFGGGLDSPSTKQSFSNVL